MTHKVTDPAVGNTKMMIHLVGFDSWTLRLPAVTAAIFCMRRPSQMDVFRLHAEEANELDLFFAD